MKAKMSTNELMSTVGPPRCFYTLLQTSADPSPTPITDTFCSRPTLLSPDRGRERKEEDDDDEGRHTREDIHSRTHSRLRNCPKRKKCPKVDEKVEAKKKKK